MPGLTKLYIESFTDMACTKSTGNSIYAMINPSTYSRNFQVNYKPSEELKKPDATMVYTGVAPSEFELTLLIDGTGVIPFPDGVSSVDNYIDKLRDVVMHYTGTIHQVSYLKITWGEVLMTGICDKLNVNYKLFDSSGAALRAEVKLSLAETKDFPTKSKEAANSSPDLTHILTVKAGDTLPLMSYRIYGDASFYMEVARANNLNSVHAIRPGDQLYFPPIKRI